MATSQPLDFAGSTGRNDWNGHKNNLLGHRVIYQLRQKSRGAKGEGSKMSDNTIPQDLSANMEQ